MKQNIGKTDRIVRLLIALAIVILYFTNVIGGTIAIVGFIAAGLLVFTSLINFCPLYWPFGINSRKKKSA
jgi:hypothetical protein